MNRTKEIILPNPGFHTMVHNGYIKSAIIIDESIINYCERKNIINIKFNKEYFN